MTAAADDTRWRRRLGRALLALALAAFFTVGIVALMMLLAGAFEPKVKPEPALGAVREPAVPPDRALGVVKLVRRPREESAVGTVRAVYEAVVASKILARVEEVRIKAGQEVKQGDIMVVLDRADLKSRMEQARSAEIAAKAKYDQAEIDLGRGASCDPRNRSPRASSIRPTPPIGRQRPTSSVPGRRSRKRGSWRRTPRCAPR